ncbi:hypothetical protein [Streptomyces tirandamycinicus]|uniref:DUF3102 domain-containing protein n=1 Tax=Streptomyces tirandamycinicus TaxID=2174846 RepID=A0A2S1SXZ4_9ACTN|nr:hypothetical protein [Streptomyces tirandamycinicus]AWI31259.1 hypothetical protein DDW44_22615 [Streptomyces tirandamycinicus]
MSKQSAKAKAGFGAALVAGLQTRGQGAQLPAQTSAQTAVDLTPEARLTELEGRIEASIGQYQQSVRQLQLRHRQELGLLLEEIRDGELFILAGYEKFGHYIKGRWGWDRSYAYRLMDLALVRRALAPLGAAVVDTLPESQARTIAPVVRQQGDLAAQQLFKEARQDATESGRKLTAAVISRRAEQFTASAQSLSDSAGEDDVVDAELVDDDAAAELVNADIRAAAAAAEKAVRLLDEALARNVAPFDAGEANQDLSRIRSAAVKLGNRAHPATA